MSKVDEVDKRLSEEEKSPITPEEQPYVDMALQALTDEQRAKISKYDQLFVIRGYQTYEPRMEETVKAMKVRDESGDEEGIPLSLLTVVVSAVAPAVMSVVAPAVVS